MNAGKPFYRQRGDDLCAPAVGPLVNTLSVNTLIKQSKRTDPTHSTPRTRFMHSLTIIASIQADQDKTELVKAELEKLVDPTQSERGCLQYDLHQDNQDPTHFLFYEIWESRKLWQDHLKSAHILAYKTATEGAIKDAAIYEMTKR
jgi:quinol monooxygenase YgiN